MLKVASCQLNQWALDFDGNLAQVKESIRQAKEQGATYRVGPEFELAGYGCEDHFLEPDTFRHCLESLADLLSDDTTDGILCEIGCPIMHQSVPYNCRVWCMDQKIVLIRPKTVLCDDGNYRESRWFTPFSDNGELEDYPVPHVLRAVTDQYVVPFGVGIIRTRDTCLGSEICEEMFVPQAMNIRMGLGGVEVFGNGSGSHHQLRKLEQRVDLIKEVTRKNGGVYLYANQKGCDGSRLYYDGCSLICINGEIVAQADQFGLLDVEVITATVNLFDVRAYRAGRASRHRQRVSMPMIDLDVNLCSDGAASVVRELRVHTPEEEIGYGPACWLWDYLRRSGASGFMLPISGGSDSAAVAAIVGIMCQMVVNAIVDGNDVVIGDCMRMFNAVPESAEELANKVFYTAYLGTQNNSPDTQARAESLAGEIGANHRYLNIDPIVDAVHQVYGEGLKFRSEGGTWQEDLAKQNIQARERMVMTYLLSQTASDGFLLVLSSGNVDEALRGYVTKYDCSSGDLNPIGSVSKLDLRRFLVWAGQYYPSLLDIAGATPTAELTPGFAQTDEEDMGLSYEELGLFGKLRKDHKMGPVQMFQHLLSSDQFESPQHLAIQVKHFFRQYGRNRHKSTVLTPAYHAESYSPDDNRYDLRQFLYPDWGRQFGVIDEMVAQL